MHNGFRFDRKRQHGVEPQLLEKTTKVHTHEELTEYAIESLSWEGRSENGPGGGGKKKH